jgi:hypothetical protein
MNDLATQKEKREDTFRRYLRSAKKELESEHTSWQRVNRWMRLAQEECTRLSEIDHIKAHHDKL